MSKKVLSRPPIVTVLGHVDHGKTTLLDKIRRTRVQGKEVGGITQSIGASVVETKEGRKITFIDTPGHAAFSKMRSSGVGVSDIALLVVAADDGVKPQTIEALDYIKKSKTPFIVVFSKTDLSTKNVEVAMGQLEKKKVLFEGRGGDVPHVQVSGKTGEGIDDLLELIILLSEVNSVEGDPNAPLLSFVIETLKSKGGPLVSCVVKEGTLKVGNVIEADNKEAKTRGLFNHKGISIKTILPGAPAQMLGFSELPRVGSEIKDVGRSEKRVSIPSKKKRSIGRISDDEVAILVKAESSGSLEAVCENLPEKVVVVDLGVGDATDSDILMAKSAGAKIFTFKAKIPVGVKNLADTEGVMVESYDLIYKLFERLEELIKGKQKVVLGKATIVAEFPFNSKKVAGCNILEGVISKGDKVVISRGKEELGEVRIISMKKQKNDVSQAKAKEECGIIFEPQLDFSIGDMLVSVRK